ncbi:MULTISPECIES: FimV/HubP family polar landmark protein [Pseudomonas]|uniref:Pilus assembly protein FimV n=1 Tax=Pseudomonas umsongensis TaxID=198618 RepID=A0ACC5MDW8_9PSED|nr:MULTISPECIES: FimV/HubP family polar landmark protein [Pseudomonas]MBB2886909.1 pilus assembly protein FimV [Pseudomonas umsongensis]NMN78361.1 pilus assembly protein FimV [Pseudomonas sp. KD5]GID05140.1 motility protein FimV [Pseudomonas sp. 008]
MVQVRKLVLAIAAASALSSGMAHALGLGELTLKSTLNQPLVAEIELLDVKDLTAAEVVPSLASPEDFAKAGVDRQAFLNDLTFTPVLNASGKSILRITSSKPLSEPMVKFLVQVMWPNGRLLRDYSVLLDPSKFSPQTADAAAQPAPAQTVTAPVTGATKSTQYTTTSRDTLWEIAAKARNGGSIQQTMLAIQALNPDAFIDGNINRLKTGQVLRLPDQVQSASLPQPKAIAEVAAQNSAWRHGRRYVAKPGSGQQQLDATKRARGDGASSQVATDKLSLVSADTGKGRGKGAAGDAKALSNKLAVTQESLDTARRDNAELKSRMNDLQSQLDKLQRLIELKNNQLAKLQAEGGAGAPAATTAPAMSAELAASPAATPVEATPTAPAPEAAAPEVVPAPAVEPTPVASDEQKFNELLTNPILLGLVGGGAVVLLLLLLLLARRRKAQQEAEKHLRMARALAEEQEFSTDLDLPESSFEGLEVPPPSVKLATAPTPAPAPAPVIAPVVVTPPIAAPLVAPAAERSDDVLAQAQSHIAAGRLNQAAALLEDAIKQEPQRSDLRLKLMEVYGQQGDRDAFVAQERQLVANGDNFARVEQLKSRFPAMVVAAVGGLAAAAVAAELDAQYVKELLLDEPQAPEPTLADFDSAFDLSLDDLEAATPITPAVAVEPAPQPQPEPEPEPEPESLAELDEFPLDDDLSFESVLQQQTEIKESLDDLSDFDLDMDLGGDASPETLAEDDFLLSLDDDLKDLPVAEAPTVTEAPKVTEAPLDDLELPADFDLSLADEMDATPDKPDAFENELNDVNAELDRLSQSLGEPSFTEEDAFASSDDELDFLSGADEVATKLDLAQAYIDMGDNDGARDILNEVVTEGDAGQKSEAKEMLSRLA